MSSSKTSWLAPFLRLRNAVDYPLRQFFQWRRPGGYRIKNQSKDNLYGFIEGDQRKKVEDLAARLLRSYCLADLYGASQRRNYRENLYYLDLITTVFKRCAIQLPDPIVAADIGVSHWFYVQALYAGLSWYPGIGLQPPASQQPVHEREVSLTGYESDPYRVYNDLYSRYDHALGHLRGLPDRVTYRPEAFEPQESRYDLVTLFFPFVFENDHLTWGLPAGQFKPDPLLQAAWTSLKTGGWLIIINQGESEHLAEIKKLDALGVTPVAAYWHDSVGLYKYKYERYVLAARHG